MKEGFVIGGGFGDLGSERALLRSETLTCVRTDGGVIEVPLDAYAVGEDGMEMAQLSFPVLEVDAGRAVELIVNKGVALRLGR